MRSTTTVCAALLATASAHARQQLVYVDPPDIATAVDDWTSVDLDADSTPDVFFFVGTDGLLLFDGIAIGVDGPHFPGEISALEPGVRIAPDDHMARTTCNIAFCYFPSLFDPATGGDWNSPGFTGIIGALLPDYGMGQRCAWIRFRAPLLPGEPGSVLDWAYFDAALTPIVAGDTGSPICPPAFIVQPRSTAADPRGTARMQAFIAGLDAQYRWFHNGDPMDDDARVSGSHSPTLTISGVLLPDSGEYHAVVTTPCGTAASDSAHLNVCPADFNDDGFLDFFDFSDFVGCFEGGPCPPGKDADFNADGFVDFFDFSAFAQAFESGC